MIPVKQTQQSQPKPKTIAERTAVKKDPEGAHSAQKTSKPRQPERSNSMGGNRAATIAIISCAGVALIGLIIFLVMLAQGALSPKEKMVLVPDLLGEYYDTLQEYEGLQIERQGSENSEQYEKGQIMYQYPPAGDEVVEGTKVFIKVSLGEEAPSKTMEQLATVKAEEAERFLLGLDMKLNIIKFDEHSATVPVGSVTRTEPASGEPLMEGQTVRLWISTGPEVIMAEVPNVVGKTYEKAVSILNANGFNNIRHNPVDSTADKDEVVAQSVAKYEKVDVTTLIVLDVSTGVSELPTDPPETTAPTEPDVTEPPETTAPTEPTTLPDGQQQLEYAFQIPSSQEPYQLTIKVGDEVFLDSMTIAPGATSVTIPLVGSGTVVYDLYYNGVYFRSETVEFDPDE